MKALEVYMKFVGCSTEVTLKVYHAGNVFNLTKEFENQDLSLISKDVTIARESLGYTPLTASWWEEKKWRIRKTS